MMKIQLRNAYFKEKAKRKKNERSRPCCRDGPLKGKSDKGVREQRSVVEMLCTKKTGKKFEMRRKNIRSIHTLQD